MFAVVKTGGKQYIVKEGDLLDIEKIDIEEGKKSTFDSVLLVSNDKDLKLGEPTLSDSKVEFEVVKQFKDKKVIIQKYKRKTGYRTRNGHRQNKTQVKILNIK